MLGIERLDINWGRLPLDTAIALVLVSAYLLLVATVFPEGINRVGSSQESVQRERV